MEKERSIKNLKSENEFCPLPISVNRKKEQNVFYLPFGAYGSPNIDFLHVDLSYLIYNKSCTKPGTPGKLTSAAWKVVFPVNLKIFVISIPTSSGFILVYVHYIDVSFQVQRQLSLQLLSNGKQCAINQRNTSPNRYVLWPKETSAIHTNYFGCVIIRDVFGFCWADPWCSLRSLNNKLL